MTWIAPSPAIREDILEKISFNTQGLITVIAQDEQGNVLMLAWMNRDAIDETLLTGRVCYYSRSRKKLWRKGETSGQEQHLLYADLDCDKDALLLTVRQKGVACHTGRRSCFYQRITTEGLTENTGPEISPETLYAPTIP